MESILNFSAGAVITTHRKIVLRKISTTTKPLFDKTKKKQKEQRPYTHFLSLPLPTESVKSTYALWRDSILAKQYDCIMPKLFLKPEIIHLTLCMLPLENEE